MLETKALIAGVGTCAIIEDFRCLDIFENAMKPEVGCDRLQGPILCCP
jgi:hypothetical protein